MLAALDHPAAGRLDVIDRGLMLDGVIDVKAHVLRAAAGALWVVQDAQALSVPGSPTKTIWSLRNTSVRPNASQ